MINSIVEYRLGRRGSFLLFLSMLDFIYAYSLAFPPISQINNPILVFLAEVLPLDIWATLWLITGLICLICSFKKDDAVGYAAGMFIKTLWAIIFLLGWLFAGVERGYLSAAIWAAFAVVLALVGSWPDPSKRQRGE